MSASRNALRTVPVLTLAPVRSSSYRVTSPREERSCFRVIARSTSMCIAFKDGLRPGRPGSCACVFFATQHLAPVCLGQGLTREILISSTSPAKPDQ